MATNERSDRPQCSDSCSCGGPSRREFLRWTGVGAAAALAGSLPAMAGPFEASDFAKLIPADKKLSPEWIASLFARGSRTIYRGEELEKIGMPVGGICAGQLYLGGDGRLWHWDIFNQPIGTGGGSYAHPPKPDFPLEQGFALRLTMGEQTQVRTLDAAGFSDITFCGEYPIGYVEYRDGACPVTVSLEAFSPFVPLRAEDSSLPATVMQFTVKNIGAAAVEAELAGWLQNAVGLYSAKTAVGVRKNRVVRSPEMVFLDCGAASTQLAGERPAIVLADFEGKDYGEWTVDGEAFGRGPAHGAFNAGQHMSGFLGKGLVNTWTGSDSPKGKLTSPSFAIERRFICFLIGGGNHPRETCINLIVDGKVVRSSTGRNTDAMIGEQWDVRDLAGKTASIEIVDNHSGGWGHIDIDQIELRDVPRTRLEDQHDFGTMGLALLEPRATDKAMATVPDGHLPEMIFLAGRQCPAAADKPLGETLHGALSRTLSLPPGHEAKITFVVCWRFPNLRIKDGGRYYATRFGSAEAVASHLASNFASLAGQTRLWHDTWYDSTLPYWFLDRTFANTSILATSTCHWLRTGRFYGWEGVGCCEGTCTHVWHYAHAPARIFPQLERDTRQRVDYGIAFNDATGLIGYRGENTGPATDGQAGTILRAYREHQMSADPAFLKANWTKIRKSLEYLIREDGNDDGIIESAQPNTLDTTWYGPISWIGSLYLAALRAGEEMAREMGDDAFARRARKIFESGSTRLVELTWNGEYFVHRADPKHPEAMKSGNGCEIDQVFGQSWAFQVGLGRILDQQHVRGALQSLWKYNFTPDVGPFRAANKMGRWYAMPGEGGLIMCTWPKGDRKDAQGRAPDWAFGYFNECMNGFEYQVAGHMIWEGMVQEGLAITRAVHDRYHAAHRNPWNEVECGDHYSRSMASLGVYLAACGYEYHGPKAHLGFAPRVSPENFRAAFTSAQGWGTFSQQSSGGKQQARIALKWGNLRLKTLSMGLPDGAKPGTVAIAVEGKTVEAKHAVTDNRITITLAEEAILQAGQKIEIAID